VAESTPTAVQAPPDESTEITQPKRGRKGIIFAVVSAFSNIAFMGAYPVWSVIVIVMDILIIYALAVHGSEVKNSYDD